MFDITWKKKKKKGKKYSNSYKNKMKNSKEQQQQQRLKKKISKTRWLSNTPTPCAQKRGGNIVKNRERK